MQDRPVVTDWMTDWDHMDPEWTEDPYRIWNKIRGEKCPIAHTERFGGAYLPVNFNDIREIAYNPESFSSRQVVVRDTQPLLNEGAPPITTDPPKHRFSRMVIMPPFSPHEIKKLIPRTRELCNQLIDRFADKGEFDGAADYSQHIPVHVIAHMLGIPDSDADQFRAWIGQILIDGILDDQLVPHKWNPVGSGFLMPHPLQRHPLVPPTIVGHRHRGVSRGPWTGALAAIPFAIWFYLASREVQKQAAPSTCSSQRRYSRPRRGLHQRVYHRA